MIIIQTTVIIASKRADFNPSTIETVLQKHIQCIPKFRFFKGHESESFESILQPYYKDWLADKHPEEYDADSILSSLMRPLNNKKFKVIQVDENLICFEWYTKDHERNSFLERADKYGHYEHETEHEVKRIKKVAGKHPVLFRYRLG